MEIDAPIHTGEQNIARVLGVGLPVLLVFWRRDCPPCRQLDPVLTRLAAASKGRALIAKIDADADAALVQRYQVTQLPGLVLIQAGRTVIQSHGAANEAALNAWLDYLHVGGARPPLPSGPAIPLAGSAAPGAGRPRRAAATAAAPESDAQPARAPLLVTDASFDQIVGGSALPVLVDFWAPWCGPCRMVASAVEQLAREFAGRALVVKLNVDEQPHTASRFGIRGIPALYIFKRGQVVEQLVGAQPIAALRQALARHAGPAPTA